MSIASSLTVGVVVIGRNEGERLVKCLKSVLSYTNAVVYVDSSSSDNSIINARSLGANVLNLDMHLPFTAARARNAGLDYLITLFPEITYVQFVDGDCEVINGWIPQALSFLQVNRHVAVACGRRIERFPERSIYNYQCNLEWNTPVGIAKACGGDFLIRLDCFKSVGGFNPSLIAGEEPELCIRLRKAGYEIRRIDSDMTWHDANITRFTEWWKRNVRAGHAYAEGFTIHGKKPEQHKKKEVFRAIFWGAVLPFIFFLSMFCANTLSLLITVLYLIQFIRLRQKYLGGLFTNGLALLSVISKFAEVQGIFIYYKNKLLGKKAKIIEYK